MQKLLKYFYILLSSKLHITCDLSTNNNIVTSSEYTHPVQPRLKRNLFIKLTMYQINCTFFIIRIIIKYLEWNR